MKILSSEERGSRFEEPEEEQNQTAGFRSQVIKTGTRNEETKQKGLRPQVAGLRFEIKERNSEVSVSELVVRYLPQIYYRVYG